MRDVVLPRPLGVIWMSSGLGHVTLTSVHTGAKTEAKNQPLMDVAPPLTRTSVCWCWCAAERLTDRAGRGY